MICIIEMSEDKKDAELVQLYEINVEDIRWQKAESDIPHIIFYPLYVALLLLLKVLNWLCR